MRTSKSSAYAKDIFRQIKGTFGRFISIMVISMLGVGTFAGLRSVSPDMRLTADMYYQEQRLMDVQIISTLGLSQADIDALREFSSEITVEPSYSMDAILQQNGAAEAATVVKLHALAADPQLNLPLLVEGRMPENAGECLASDTLLRSVSLEVGQQVTLDSGVDDHITEFLSGETFTIVGVARLPMYVSDAKVRASVGDGSAEGVLLLPEEAFTVDVYTCAYLAIPAAAQHANGTDAYYDFIDNAIDSMESLAHQREIARYDEVVGEASEEIADAEIELLDGERERDEKLAEARATIEDARQKIADGEKELADGEIELEEKVADARRELADAEKKVRDGEADLAQARIDVDEAEIELADGLKELEDGEKELADAKIELDKGREDLARATETVRQGEISLMQGLQALREGEEELERNRLLMEAAEEQLNEAEQSLIQLELAIASGMSQIPIEAAKALLAQGKADYAAGLAEYQAGMALLSEGEVQLREGRAEYEEGVRQFRSGYVDYQDGVRTFNDAEKLYYNQLEKLEEGRQELEDGRRELDEAYIEIADGELELADAKREISKGIKKIDEAEAEGLATIAEARQKLEDGKRELEDGQREYDEQEADSAKKIADAWIELEDAKQKVADVEACEWYFFDRQDLPSYTDYYGNTDRISALGIIIPMVFFGVALLISLTTMTRMVEEQRAQVGVMKVMGYSRTAIAMKYIMYAFMSSALGAWGGSYLGRFFFPQLVADAFSIMYTMPPLLTPYQVGPQLTALVLAMSLTSLSAYFAARYELSQSPAQLLRPKAPKPGKRILLERIPFLWRKTPFGWKVTMRNLFRYKQRFLMTTLGIAGCTALLITGFGVLDSLNQIAPRQFVQIWHYDMLTIVDAPKFSGEERAQVEQTLTANGAVDLTWWRTETVPVLANGAKVEPSIIASRDIQALSRLVTLRDVATGEELSLEGCSGAIITEKISKLLGINAGDDLTFTDEDNRERTVRVEGVVNNYVDHYIFMTSDVYEAVMQNELLENAAAMRLTDTSEAAQSALAEELLAMDDVVSTVFTTEILDNVISMFDQLNVIVYVIIVSAGALALAVLYNLNNINLAERVRELATLKVLGFRRSEMADYILRESIILTLLGILVGNGLGRLLHAFVMKTAEVNMVVFPLYVAPLSYAIADVLTLGFASIVFLFLLPKVFRINMVESLKSVE